MSLSVTIKTRRNCALLTTVTAIPPWTTKQPTTHVRTLEILGEYILQFFLIIMLNFEICSIRRPTNDFWILFGSLVDKVVHEPRKIRLGKTFLIIVVRSCFVGNGSNFRLPFHDCTSYLLTQSQVQSRERSIV